MPQRPAPTKAAEAVQARHQQAEQLLNEAIEAKAKLDKAQRLFVKNLNDAAIDVHMAEAYRKQNDELNSSLKQLQAKLKTIQDLLPEQERSGSDQSESTP